MRCDTPEESGSSPRKSTERCMVNIFCRTEYINFTLMTGTSFRYSALLSTIRTCFCVSTYTPNLGNLPLPATRLVQIGSSFVSHSLLQPCTNVVQVNATSLAFSTTPSIHPASLSLVPYSIQPNGSEASISPEHHSKSIALDQQPKQIPHLSLHPSIKPSTLSK